MDFFALQERAQKASRRMVLLFALAVLAIVAAVNTVVLLSGIGWYRVPDDAALHLDYATLAAVSLLVLAFIGFASLFRTLSLRAGGSAVARGMGATPVPADTSDPAWRQLRNVVEEIAIASGLPVPEVYVMEGEDAINAFAAGHTPADAAICVTQGSLDQLSRDELQGVIAHEFSHILNGDMRLNIRLIGLLFGILILSIVGRVLLQSGGRVRGGNRNGGGAHVLVVGIGLLIIGYVGHFFGRLIQAAVARSRESLADASAVQFTRQTAGLAGALKKIAALPAGSALQAQDAQQVAHMLFGEGLRGARLFATHPPLLQRIRALEPDFDPQELEQLVRRLRQGVSAAPTAPRDASADDPGRRAPAAMLAPAAAALPDAAQRIALSPDAVTARVATPQAPDFALSQQLQQHLPADLLAAARSPKQAAQLVLALALMRATASTPAREQLMVRLLGQAQASQIVHHAARLHTLHAMLRLPLAALLVPSLRRLSAARRAQVQQQLQAIVLADGSIELAEYCLVKLVQIQVADAFAHGARAHDRATRLRQRTAEARDLLSLLARAGSAGDEAAARVAFDAAQGELELATPLSYACPQDWQPALDLALDRLDRLPPREKARLLRALTIAIHADGRVTVAEAELLRVVCAALHCPLPPLVQLPEGATPAARS